MRTMEVLLREHVKDLGRCGEVVKVAAGYMRNYLAPRRLAVPATSENKRQLSRRAERMALEDAQRTQELDALAEALAKVALKTSQKADEQGRLYGSVNAALVAELLSKAGYATEERNVRLDTPIKSVGEHPVSVHIHGERYVEVAVTVEAEAGA